MMLHFHETQSFSPEQPIDDEKLSMTGRLTPIGGVSSEGECDRSFNEEYSEKTSLLEEYEKLTASLAALTRHFAHVQLRLQQVVSAPTPEDRENLLVELHKFASNGIPDVMCQTSMFANEHIIEAEKCREKEFINDLKHKLDELEHYAAASGSLEGAPTLVMLEKQKVLIDELRKNLDLELDDALVSKLSAEELRKLVDQGIYQLTNPVKLKQKLINQMHTQISDLEKFVEFLKVDAVKTSAASTVYVPSPITISIGASSTAQSKSPPTTTQPTRMDEPTHSYSSCFHFQPHSLNILQSIKKLFILTQLYTIFLLSCGTRSMKKKSHQSPITIRKDIISNKHFGDIRAQLEIAIDKVLNAVQPNQTLPQNFNDNDTSSTSGPDEYELEKYTSSAVILSVRQEFTSTLRALLEHGLYETNYSRSLSHFVCLPISFVNNSSTQQETMHIWQLFLKFYDMKQGYEYTNSAARKLSQSFSLDIIGGKAITLKQSLLNVIDTIVRLHQEHPNQMDSCFKSFVCYALNEKKLVSFLRLILQTPELVANYYQPWSYMKQTGFNDALHSLDRLTLIDFHLPINTSVRRFMNHQDLIE